MKKYSAILFAVILAVLMVVPVSASSTAFVGSDGVSYPDTFKVNDTFYSLKDYYNNNKAQYPDLAYIVRTGTESDPVTKLYRTHVGWNLDYNNSTYHFYNKDDGPLDVFHLIDGVWVLDSSVNVNADKKACSIPKTIFTWSSDTFYLSDGTLKIQGDANFMRPLWQVVERVTQGEMQTMVPTLGGQVRTLVLCGVGCLASLMVLKLFGKRSLIFRS